MIQVCSRCGTRWNVRDRRRAWCPRCNGALWAPLTPGQEAELQWAQPGHPAPPGPSQPGPESPPRLGPGYRWIAVRPGPPPPPRRRRRPLGPTPRYSVMPRWTLMGAPNPVAAQRKPEERVAPPARSLEKALGGAIAALGLAALVHALIYLLMIINRTRLLHPLIAGGAVWLGRLAGLAAIAAVVHCAVVLTRWLLARRAAAFARQHLPESRPAWALWAGCLVPLVNLAWAPVYALELAGREDRLGRLRKPIVVWWLVWAVATAAAVFATATSWTDDAQGIADNMVATVVAYLLGLAAVVAASRVVEGFEQRSMGRPAHRWVAIADDRGAAPAGPPETASSAEPETVATPAAVDGPGGREPAA
ncbi:DUF4328 domain-containing protein [Mycolicibacter sinensis]|uniref:DUF4328 domain-containing protein n=1 Tax=Mycolicibacter sinensis (strain JDM601) TaxID=875328 RepID=A0A1A2EJW0_MYCSD|nr:DUF4328 domain-containing protein [Mycolicibacter sinensis]OBG04784.1 hypothetical protein A5771_10915 [Mycolicibacter sinensis]OBG04841.1 hypothetical protein A5772_04100 [Mycolicibacter sinensis]